MQIGFFSILSLILITLKLIGFIDWSWFLVLLPVAPGLIFLVGLVIWGTVVVVGDAITRKK